MTRSPEHAPRSARRLIAIGVACLLWLVLAGGVVYLFKLKMERMRPPGFPRTPARTEWKKTPDAGGTQSDFLKQALIGGAEQKARAGDPVAMLEVASYLDLHPSDSTSVPSEAFAWRLRAAGAGHRPAMVEVARAYENGRGAERDIESARRWFERAAELDDVGSAERLGNMFYHGREVTRDYAEALKWYQRAAKLGSKYARGQLGWMHESGLGVPRDYVAAYHDYLPLAEGGDAWAQNKMGYLLQRGLGVGRDEKAAVAWFRKAADQKQGLAMANLGQAYIYGRGVERDDAEGLKWLQASANLPNAVGLRSLGQLYLTGGHVSKDESRGAVLIKKASDLNDAGAQVLYAHLLQTGKGVPKDEAAARALLEKGVKSGDVTIKAALSRMLLRPAGNVAPDFVRARLLMKDAADRDVPEARVWHALYCRLGIGGPRDPGRALQDLQTAVDRGDANAMIFLAMMLAEGEASAHLAPDMARARQLVDTAAQKKNGLAKLVLAQMTLEMDLETILAGKKAESPSEESEATKHPPPENIEADHVPEVEHTVRPRYPLELRFLGLEGQVVVDFVVGVKGEVINAYPIRTTLPGFERAAVDAVSRWHFKPGTKDGSPVPVHMQVPIVFSLEQEPAAENGLEESSGRE